MAKHILSKSTFIRGQQCLKSLYLYKNRYFLKDPVPPEQWVKFKRGWSVNEFAHSLYPGGEDVSPPSQKAADRTARLMAEGQEVIYEAAFTFDDVLIAIDMLVKTPEGWKAIEVKSSAGLSATYYKDACLQYYVITGSGTTLCDFELVHINPEYKLHGELNPSALFCHVSVKTYAESKLDWVQQQVAIEKLAVLAGKSPVIDIGPHCNDPYPCDFQRLCRKKIPQGSVFEMGGFAETEKFDLYRHGFMTPESIPASYNLSDLHRQIVNSHISGQVFADKLYLGSLLGGSRHPLTFISLLTCRPAIPLYEGTSPYDRLFFSCSLARTDAEGNLSMEKSFIASADSNPSDQVAAFIRNEIHADDCIVMWNRETMPEDISLINEKSTFFLFDVFNSFAYYHPSASQTDNCISIYNAIEGSTNSIERKYFSDIVAGSVFANMAESMAFGKVDADENELDKLASYCHDRVLAMAGIFSHISRL